MAAAPPQNPQNITANETNGDVFSMTDDGLARRFQFQNEHGVGNWGSVWLALDKRTQQTAQEKKVAIKVVHRSKTQTTAARVRALWNEMKTVRSLRESGECHPSIIAFDCFIISPSYALIVMEFLPTLLPVPVDESTAMPWMASLASAVEFMHSHGVVHNDIKPANILLSANNTPTLVDFGFSERYGATEEPSSSPARPSFLSSLAYGTPEYLSPERAAGHMHDTRKADVWSLGVTFFELLFNRTPFEHDRCVGDKGDKGDNAVVAGGSACADKAAMDAYWARTMKGKWYDTDGNKLRTKMSSGLEAMLRRMISPNADVRYTSTQVLKDPYWADSVVPKSKGAKMAGGIPAVNVDSATPAPSSGTLSSVVRTVLGNKQNVMGAGKGVAPTGGQAEQKLVISPGGAKGDGKENTVPRSPRPANAAPTTTAPTKLRKERSGARLTKTPAAAKPDESVESPLPVEQEALRVREIAADTRVDRMAIWVQNVERVVEDAKKIVARGDSQPLLPPLPRVPSVGESTPISQTSADAASSATPQSSRAHPQPIPASSPSSATVSASGSRVARPRANHIFAAPPSSTHRRAIAIGNSADLNAPVQVLRHVVSADYPFSGKAVDGQGNDGGRGTDGVKVVIENRAGIRKIKSDLVKGHNHARSVSYNSMYLGKGRPTPVPVIPEVRVEDADDAEKQSQVVFASNDVESDAKASPPAHTELFYDQLIVGTNVVERIGKGYQSNLCTQNDHATLRKSAHTPTSTHGRLAPSAAPTSNTVRRKLSASNFFLSMLSDRPCEAEEACIRTNGIPIPTVSACPPARPRRKIRQAASFDGFCNFARAEKGHAQAPARPVSEHLPPTPTRDPCGTPAKVEKKRSTVTKTMRKAFLAIIGGGGGGSIEKAH